MRKSIPFVKKIRILLEECHLTDPDEQTIDALIFGSNSKHTLTNLLLSLILLCTSQEPKKLQANNWNGFQSTFLLVLMHWNTVKLPQKQVVFAVNLAVSLFVCVDVVVRSLIFPSDLYGQVMDQRVVQVVKRIIGKKFVAHQNLTKSNKRQVVAVQGIPRHRKENRMQRSIFITLKFMMKLQVALKRHSQTSCIVIPYQLIRSQKKIPKPSYRYKWSLISARNRHFVKHLQVTFSRFTV